MIGIYKITNNKNGKVYIGQSIDIERRWQQHKSLSEYKNSPLYDDVRKFGWDKFSFAVLEICEEHELNAKEKQWIQLYNSFVDGYNQTRGGAKGETENYQDIQISLDWNKFLAAATSLTPSTLKYWLYLEYCRERNSFPNQKEFCEMFNLAPATFRKARLDMKRGE